MGHTTGGGQTAHTLGIVSCMNILIIRLVSFEKLTTVSCFPAVLIVNVKFPMPRFASWATVVVGEITVCAFRNAGNRISMINSFFNANEFYHR